MYQLCPKCDGVGWIGEYVPIFNTLKEKHICSVCKGECIIHKESGLPPSRHNNKCISVIKLTNGTMLDLTGKNTAGINIGIDPEKWKIH